MESVLKATLLSLFRPLVRYLIGQGLTYPALSELLKMTYIAEAERHYSGEKATTDSRISLLTGVHRKDVKRLRTALREESSPPVRRGEHLAARVIATWVSTPRYLDKGRPRILPMRAGGRHVSFEALVRAVKADLRPKVVLDELQRVGVVEVDVDNRIRLLRTAYVSASPGDKLEFLAANVGDHLRSALHNISTPGSPFLERAVYYDAVPAQSLARLREEFFEQGDRFLRQINQQVMPLDEEQAERPVEERRRMRFGVYYYEEDNPRADPGSAGQTS